MGQDVHLIAFEWKLQDVNLWVWLLMSWWGIQLGLLVRLQDQSLYRERECVCVYVYMSVESELFSS